MLIKDVHTHTDTHTHQIIANEGCSEQYINIWDLKHERLSCLKLPHPHIKHWPTLFHFIVSGHINDCPDCEFLSHLNVHLFIIHVGCLMTHRSDRSYVSIEKDKSFTETHNERPSQHICICFFLANDPAVIGCIILLVQSYFKPYQL